MIRRILLTGPKSINQIWALSDTDVMIQIEASDIRVQEDMHLVLCHILAGEVRSRIAAQPESNEHHRSYG